MPVRKFRSVEEMTGARRRASGGPENLRIACELSELAYALHPWRFEPGVRKFASIEAASEHRERWRRDQARRPVRATGHGARSQ